MTGVHQPSSSNARTAPVAATDHRPRAQRTRQRRIGPVIVRTIGELAVTAGALVLLFVGWQLWWTDVLADREHRAAVATIQQEWREHAPAAATPQPSGPAPALTVPEVPAVEDGSVFGVLRVPRWGDDYAVPLLEGIDSPDLRRGVGHYPGTAMPGSMGNFATAGHRTTYGKPYNRIDELLVGDEMFVDTGVATFVYRVRDSEIVTPDRVDMVAPVPGRPGQAPVERLMTLTACHPEYSAEYRWITIAVLDRVLPPPTA